MRNEETFTEVYKRYAALVMKSVVAQTNDRELAAEICQQTFLAYYRNMEAVEPEFVKAWLLHVAKNLLIDHWRKASTRKEILVDGSDMLNREMSGPDMEKQCTDRLFLQKILAELKEENELWYEVIDYICIREVSHEETAKHLGISSAVLRARLYRAKHFLQAKYGTDFPGGI